MRRPADPRLWLTAGSLLLLGACSSVAAKPAPRPASVPATPARIEARAVVGLATATPSPSPTPARIEARTVVPRPVPPGAAAGSPAPAPPTPAAARAPDSAPVRATPVATSPGCTELSRLLIPRIGVNAGFVTLGLLPDTAMDAPKTKDDVGCYALDGYDGSNLVLGGHVDWHTGEAGVFWDLRRLQQGDEVQLVLSDGSLVRYQVTSSQVYDAKTADVGAIVANQPAPTVTLITCDGDFSPATGEYDKSRVVRAVKVAP